MNDKLNFIVLVLRMSFFQKLGGDLSKYLNILTWFETCKKFEGSAENLHGAEILANAVNSILKDRL